MLRSTIVVLSFVALNSGCATSVPLAVSCPESPPAPAALAESVSSPPSLSERYNELMRQFVNSIQESVTSLEKAMTPESSSTR